MTNTLALITLLFIHFIGSAQTLKDVFMGIPDRYLGITQEQRDTLINNYLVGKNNSENGVGISGHYITVYDPKYGYLVFTGAYEGTTVVTFWNVSSGKKLVGIVKSSCGGACDNTLIFLLGSETSFEKRELSSIIPRLLFSDFMDLDRMKRDGIDVERERSVFETYDLLYNLLSKGKNIVVECQYQELAMDDKLEPYSFGQKIELIWNDGQFVKGRFIE